MTPEAQRIAIAEECGFKPETRKKYAGASNVQGWGRNQHLSEGHKDRQFIPQFAWELLPDYLNDLNAMHEAVKSQPPSVMKAMRFWLFKMCDEMTAHEATAAQRAEAFLRTVGKWTDA